MATFLDIGLVSKASFIFAFILVWCIVYAVLSYSKTFEAKENIRALIALMVALLTMLSPPIVKIVSIIAPWFSLGFVFIFFLLVGIMMFGIDKNTVAEWVKGSGSGLTIRYWIIIVSAIILVGALGAVFFSGDPTAGTQTNISASEGTTTDGSVGSVGAGALMATIFHPKMLGAIFVMLLALFTVLQLAK
ncbi:MAG TPA: hypothetical protein VK158_02080 [Acidobacteriota bacterium]|nr:hypothetical protein [Acidobacteriota bacterium]